MRRQSGSPKRRSIPRRTGTKRGRSAWWGKGHQVELLGAETMPPTAAVQVLLEDRRGRLEAVLLGHVLGGDLRSELSVELVRRRYVHRIGRTRGHRRTVLDVYTAELMSSHPLAPPEEHRSDRPTVILVHGAANSAAVWRFWQQELTTLGWRSHAIDLRGHGTSGGADLSVTTMHDYADDVASTARKFSTRPIVIGWSMGGLVAMLVADAGLASACVGLAPSTPVLHKDENAPLRAGVFGPKEYGIVSRDPALQPAMSDLDPEERAVALSSLGAESRLARDERKRGIVIQHLQCPLLIVTAEREMDRPQAMYKNLHLPAELVSIEDCSHWGLVLNRRALARAVPTVSRWMARVTRV